MTETIIPKTVAKRPEMEIVDDLEKLFKEATKIQIKLAADGKDNEAKKIERVTLKLSRRIDDEMGSLIDDWVDHSSAVLEDIQQLNESLEAARINLDKEVDKTQKIVDAIGQIDDVIELATSLLKP